MIFSELSSESSIPVAIEQFGSKDFFSNYAGWTRNDINALQACTTKAQYDALLQRLTISEPKYNVKDGSKFVDALKSVIPRWCQSPNELMLYAQQIAEGAMDTMDDAYKKALEDNKSSDSDVKSAETAVSE